MMTFRPMLLLNNVCFLVYRTFSVFTILLALVGMSKYLIGSVLDVISCMQKKLWC